MQIDDGRCAECPSSRTLGHSCRRTCMLLLFVRCGSRAGLADVAADRESSSRDGAVARAGFWPGPRPEPVLSLRGQGRGGGCRYWGGPVQGFEWRSRFLGLRSAYWALDDWSRNHGFDSHLQARRRGPALAQPALGPAGSDPRRVSVVLAVALLFLMIRHTTVHQTEVGLLYRKGRYERLLEAGRHRLLGRQIEVVRVDTRRRLLTVASQEVLTADSVQLRFTVAVAFKVTDPVTALHDFESYEQELHLATQLALRAAVGERSVDDLLEQRGAISSRLEELVAAQAPNLGLEIDSVQLRDVMLPGNLKTAFADILQARAAGRAALERARGESAALRSLANAARMLDATPGLMNLRLLQTMEQDAALPGTTRFVVHLPSGDPSTSSSADRASDEA